MKKYFIAVALLILLTPASSSGTLGEHLGSGSGITTLLLHLNGNSTDTSGNANNGTDTSITYGLQYGYFGQGTIWNGTNSKIDVGTGASLSTHTFTWNWWVNPSSSVTGVKALAGQSTSANAPSMYIRNSDGKIQLDKDGAIAICTSNTAVTLNTWQMITITYDSGTGVCNHYRNGKPDGSATSATTFSFSNTQVGVMASAHFYSGQMDEVIRDNVVWSASKVLNHYNMTKGRGRYAPQSQ